MVDATFMPRLIGQTGASAADAPTVSSYGLCIRSTIALPGAVASTNRSRAPDVEIVEGITPVWDAARAWGVYRVASPDRFEIAVPGVARFTCLDRRRIVVDPIAGADRAHIADMLIATVLPALLWARGEVVLHAAAFLLPGASHAIAVAGVSGSGKSTALAHALTIGARQVADDSVRVGLSEQGAVASGLSGGYFERIDDRGGRIFRAVPPEQVGDACPLGALLVLTPDVTTPHRLSGADAIAALLRHRHRPRIAALLGTEPTLLPVIAAIARTLPIVAIRSGRIVDL